MAAIRRWSTLFILLWVAVLASAEEIHVTLLHINDLYEVSPIEGGKVGGVARLSTLRAQLLRRNRNTYTILAGDVLSPSVLGTAEFNGKPIAGAQMIAALNFAGLDYATFGNHEFDLTEEEFHSRIRDSRFVWFSGNVRNSAGDPFPGVRQNVVFTVEGEHGGHVRVGLIGLTLDQNQRPWLRYTDPIQTAREQVTNLRNQGVDVVIAVTHQTIAQDEALATQVPGIDMILGGHEHENMKVLAGPKHIPILKADANLRSAYVHDLVYDTEHHSLQIDSRLQPINDSIPEDPTVAKVANDWTERAFISFRKIGFEPNEVIANVNETLQGKQIPIRLGPTNLTDTIATALLHAFPQAEASIFNAGSIRIDDDLPPAPIRQYDVLRILPFGGNSVLVECKGSLLTRVLDVGQSNRGNGGYLQTANVTRAPQGAWLVNGQPIDPNRTYRIATTAYLLTGSEKNLAFLTRSNPEVVKVTEGKDVRFPVIEEFRKRWPKGSTQP